MLFFLNDFINKGFGIFVIVICLFFVFFDDGIVGFECFVIDIVNVFVIWLIIVLVGEFYGLVVYLFECIFYFFVI